MRLGVAHFALAIAAFGLFSATTATPATADTSSEIRALKARLLKLEAAEAEAKREAKAKAAAAAQHASAAPAGHGAVAAGAPPAPQHWYERLSLRGYTQMRYNDILSGGPFYNDISTPGDKSVGPRQNFFIRRARMILSGDVSDHLYLYFQNDFASAPSGTFSNSPTFNPPGNFAAQQVYYYYNQPFGLFAYPGWNQQGNYSSAPGNFGQIRDLYADIYFDKDKEFRVRAGQSKIPYGFENMQSSQNRLALDRADAINSCCKDERDLGLFFYYTPKEMRHLFRDLVKNNLKGTGDYGMVGFGVYNGQGANRIELNKNTHLVARFTYPYVFENGQIVEASVQGYTGKFVPYTTGIRPSLGMGTNWAGFIPSGSPLADIGSGFTPYVDGSGWNNLGNYNLSSWGARNGWGPVVANGGTGIQDSRVAVTGVIYPQPFGIRAEWNWGVGPQLNETQTAITKRTLNGGYVEATYKYEDKEFGTGTWFPFVKWQYYNGGAKFENNAPLMRVNEWDVGVEYQPLPELEFTAIYSHMDRTNVQAAPYRQFQADLMRMQLQWNY
ncbi:OprO/OprP family phosphate-selective porin [Methylocystis sp. WRRC1]|uniref:porin n=1 Tax=Methylocystis sp. WRRC1 TaxID=1732014 RepID=UPI001D1512E3|nr:porin [Methylocystis sp. WRRC1]MCC3247137.1 OprO/OprP family phosphate-selective porin [Methylocystis sp. WRRC1]